MDMPFADWLKQRRKVLDLTQQELAWQVGCSAILLRKLEAGERRPSKQIAERLADVLAIPAYERTGFTELARKGKAAQSYLPMLTTPFIGRKQELIQIGKYLMNPNCRLLTLVGAGGMGKTCLAIQAAAASGMAFKNRVYFVGLASVPSAEFIVPAIANSVGLALVGNASPEQQLLAYLHDKNMLLILDSFEHLMNGRGLVIKLLENAPLFKLLVTSQERLSLQHEWILEIAGLPFDSEQEAVDDASQLFILAALRRSRQIEENELPTVLEICRLLDGMPLGIELAASWLHLFSCREIVDQIHSNAQFLRTDAYDIEERHRNLWYVFDHSWSLLSLEAQAVLKKLAVFQGGFQLEAAQAVGGASLENLADLRNKSLIRRDITGRFQIHALLRQYLSQQQTVEEKYQAHSAHAQYYIGYLLKLGTRVISYAGHELAKAFIEEIENIRLAWRWSAETNELGFLMEMYDKLWLAFLALGWVHEGKAAFAYACANLQGLDRATRQTYALMRGIHSWFEWDLGHLELALEQGFEAVACFEEAGITSGQEVAICNNHLGLFLHSVGRYDEAKMYGEKALALLHQTAYHFDIAAALYNLGRISCSMGDYTTSKARIEAATGHLQAMGGTGLSTYFLEVLGRIEMAQGHYEAAKELLQNSRQTFLAIGDQRGISFPIISLGRLAHLRGDYAEAQYWFGEGARLTYKLQIMSDLLEIIAESAYLVSQTQRSTESISWLHFVLNHPAMWYEARERATGYLAEMQPESPPVPVRLEAIMEVIQQWGVAGS